MKHTLGLLTALLLSPLVALQSAEPSASAPKPAGLTKGPNATVLRDGKPYRSIGVNYFDCFLRTLNNDGDTSYEAGFATLAAKGIPFARFCATGFWPRDMKLYQTDRAEYFRRLDGVVKSAEKNGIGLVPSLFWYHACVPDLVGEPMDQWGNPQSKTHAWMREYVREIVTRYRDHPTIWAWELGNEFSLSASLPNAKDHRPKTHADLGTPATRSERDDLTYAMLRVAFAEFGKAVREHDAGRLILTGDSFPRPSAWHQENENKWTRDTPEQFAEILTLANPDPISAISLHAYDADDQRFATAMEVSRKLDKPLFIGEFGAPDETPGQAEKFRSLLKAIVDHDVPLAALWVFDLKSQKEWSVTADNARAWQLDLISEANKRRNNSHPLVTRLSGDLPIILSAPHGGQRAIPNVLPRQGKGVRDFVTKTDAETARLTEELADAIAKISGKRPYVVIARFHRKFVDANRAPKLAYESDLAKPVYDAYQQALAETRQTILDRWGGGILLDIHGQSLAPDTIYRGTQQGKSTAHLVKRFGKEALTGEKSLFGQFAKQGFTVDPPVGSLDRESHYSGGHIIATYGSAAGGTFDAIQIELGKNLRSATQRNQTVEKMAIAITDFANDYLPKDEIANGARSVPKLPEKIRVGVYRDEGAGPSADDLSRTLAKYDNITVRNLTAADIKSGKLKEVDVLIQPGGSGGGQGRRLEEHGRDKIREFVRSGGGYLGICAGAYLATSHYPWSLNILDAKVVDREHWARGKGTVEIELSEQGKHLLGNQSDRLKIHYAQGPLLAPANHPNIPDYETLATFNTEIALNGAPKGVMPGTTAAAEGRFGNGRVICFSPHPEMTKGLEDLLLHAIGFVNQDSSHTSNTP